MYASCRATPPAAPQVGEGFELPLDMFCLWLAGEWDVYDGTHEAFKASTGGGASAYVQLGQLNAYGWVDYMPDSPTGQVGLGGWAKGRKGMGSQNPSGASKALPSSSASPARLSSHATAAVWSMSSIIACSLALADPAASRLSPPRSAAALLRILPPR